MKITKLSIFLFTFFLAASAAAQNNVVVIPLEGDDVAMAQQHFRYTQSSNIGGNIVNMCYSNVFDTPDQQTEVLLIANATARFTADSDYWWIMLEVSKNGGSFVDLANSTAFNKAHEDAFSQISTTGLLDLDPNSSYQFRIQLDASQSTGDFKLHKYCELVVTASYKLPPEKNILEARVPSAQ